MAIQPRRTRGDLQRRASALLAATIRRALTSLLARYLAATLGILALVLALAPTPRGVPTPEVWDYQRDHTALHGGGILNAYARTTLSLTTVTARTAIERQRDLHRYSLLDAHIGQPAARAVALLRTNWQLALEVTTAVALVALVIYRAAHTPHTRSWLAAILLLLTTTVLLTHPHTLSRAAAAPGRAVQTLSVAALTLTDPTRTPTAPGVTDTTHQIAHDYWTAFVADPVSRLQTGTPVLADAPPDTKPAARSFLAERISAVNDWALGRNGPERAVIATFALAYALPFALAVWALSMLATAAQALLWLLLLAGAAAAPLAVDPRWRPGVIRLWLKPLGGTAAVLAVATLTSLGTLRAATLINLGDEYLGMLLAGAILPAAAAALTIRRLLRRWRHRTPKPPTRKPLQPQPAGGQPSQPGQQQQNGRPEPLGGVA